MFQFVLIYSGDWIITKEVETPNRFINRITLGVIAIDEFEQ